MTFDIIIAAMTAKHGINPEWGGCRPGILAGASQDYTFLLGYSPVGFSAREVAVAVEEWLESAAAVHAAGYGNAGPTIVDMRTATPEQVQAFGPDVRIEAPKKKGGKK